MIKIAVIGATGYTGIELIRLLQNHPQAEVCYASTESYAGEKLAHIYPHLGAITSLVGENLNMDKVAATCDIAFIALPHGHAAPIASTLLAKNKKVIDLGADLRLKNTQDYEQWYQHKAAPHELLKQAVYGLPEIGLKNEIAKAQLIANPGCYATAAILAAAPLLKTDWIDWSQCIFDGKSGVSGAGRSLSLNTHFCETAENFSAYQLAGKHRHTPEIEQALSLIKDASITIEFTPHLMPMVRGLFMNAYFKLHDNVTEDSIRALYEKYYADATFVDVLPEGTLLQTKQVRGTNRCDLAIHFNPRTQRITVTSVIDNLIKGAAGQAIQNMNLMCGLPEEMGLNNLTAMYP